MHTPAVPSRPQRDTAVDLQKFNSAHERETIQRKRYGVQERTHGFIGPADGQARTAVQFDHDVVAEDLQPDPAHPENPNLDDFALPEWFLSIRMLQRLENPVRIFRPTKLRLDVIRRQSHILIARHATTP
jgi:hypothetical protein